METIVDRNKFGICPNCGHALVLFKTAYSAYTLSPTAWISSEIDKKIEYKGICKKCEYVIPLHLTERGLEPVGFEGEPTQKPILGKNNEKIGYLGE